MLFGNIVTVARYLDVYDIIKIDKSKFVVRGVATHSDNRITLFLENIKTGVEMRISEIDNATPFTRIPKK